VSPSQHPPDGHRIKYKLFSELDESSFSVNTELYQIH
jgi:hypothetical protein